MSKSKKPNKDIYTTRGQGPYIHPRILTWIDQRVVDRKPDPC
uniref:Uncharacterized protein n=1 Tax=Arundo donax TaxID=35708 RepID=A0A0A8ZD13_ARUDO